MPQLLLHLLTPTVDAGCDPRRAQLTDEAADSDEGNTALMVATSIDHRECVRVLLESPTHGAPHPMEPAP